MNRRHVFLALACWAGLATAASPDAARTASAPSVPAAAQKGLSGTAGKSAAPLGSWKSTQAPAGTLTGRIVLSADGSAVLAADGQPELKGRWSVPAAGQLSFDMPPHGVANMRFERPRPDVLVLVYENGTRQTFNKEASPK